MPYANPAAAKKSYAISMNVFKKMEEVNLLVEEKQYREALLGVSELLERRSSKYEKAQVYSLMGSIHYRNNDLQSAIESFKKVLDSVGDMPLSLHTQTLKTLGQLSLVVENFQQARDYCEQIIEIAGDTLKPIDYTLLAQANYKLEDWNKALEAALGGRELSLEMEKIPKQNLLLLLNAIYFELGQMDNMRGVLEELIKHYPKKSYMLNLASVYGQLDRLDKQTVLMESLYEDGRIVDGSQLRNLASLYLSENSPYKGAIVLETALENGQLEATANNFEMLAQAWRLAAEREKAITTLNQAAKLSDDGDNYLQKAYLHFDMAQWKNTVNTLKLGFDKGLSEKLEGEAWLLMGMAHFKMKEYQKAIEACEYAKNYEKSLKHAQNWISYISNEQRKVESMREVLN
ncbi:MAG: tetratricopeptide (TPR) repeat protein [Alphaproteobacteria bacterium]|jgi:tetratricopeptide (TPR) repeat protein